jgi:GT2 family glycosyltransferase
MFHRRSRTGLVRHSRAARTMNSAVLEVSEAKPMVSVCVPVFNAASSIGRCLDAVLRQDLASAEILVIDNQSTDGTLAEVARVLRGVRAARVIVNESNVGRIENWNRCIHNARGTYVKFVMANDVLWRSSVALLVAQALEGPDAVIVSSRHQFWDGGAAEVPEARRPERIACYSGTEAIECVRAGGNPFWALNGALIRREHVVAHSIQFDTHIPYCADLDFCARLSIHGLTVHVPAPTYWFNTGVKSRVYFTGFVPESFFAEVRQVHRSIDAVLREAGRPIPSAESGLLRVLAASLAQGTMSLSPLRTASLFAEPRYKVLAAAIASTHRAGIWGALQWLRCFSRFHLAGLVPVVRWLKHRARLGPPEAESRAPRCGEPDDVGRPAR